MFFHFSMNINFWAKIILIFSCAKRAQLKDLMMQTGVKLLFKLPHLFERQLDFDGGRG